MTDVDREDSRNKMPSIKESPFEKGDSDAEKTTKQVDLNQVELSTNTAQSSVPAEPEKFWLHKFWFYFFSSEILLNTVAIVAWLAYSDDYLNYIDVDQNGTSHLEYLLLILVSILNFCFVIVFNAFLLHKMRPSVQEFVPSDYLSDIYSFFQVCLLFNNIFTLAAFATYDLEFLSPSVTGVATTIDIAAIYGLFRILFIICGIYDSYKKMMAEEEEIEEIEMEE